MRHAPFGAVAQGREKKLVDLLEKLAITLAIALGTAFLQIIMKGISRTELVGKRHGLTRDDLLFWTDWTIAGSLSLVLSIIATSTHGKPVLPGKIWFSIIALVLSCSAVPFFLRVFAYDANATLKTWGWWGIGWILIANSIGILVLLAAVTGGAEIYGTS